MSPTCFALTWLVFWLITAIGLALWWVRREEV